jgi:hypothetical protein
MPLPCPSGQISLADIQNEFGGSNPISINEYYANGGRVPSGTGTVPTSGQISFSNFFCALNEIVVYITQNSENVNVKSLFDALNTNYWTQNVRKRVVINSGVVVGSRSTSQYALTVPSGASSTVTLENYGSILGAGGAANGGTGGNAIFAGSSGISINNQGTIYSGGGGGGRGGTGGQGFYTYDCSYVQDLGSSGFGSVWGCDDSCVLIFGGGAYCTGNCIDSTSCDPYRCDPTVYTCYGCSRYISQTCTAYTSGGVGGSGGVGQGYNQSSTSGSAGSAGGINAGTGGTGGTGGGWGSSGNNGGSGSNGNYTSGSSGSSGGLAGFYIVNNSNVTWINTGTVAGRVG